MMTIVTQVTLREDGVEQWEQAMQSRVDAAQDRPGWVAVQLLRPVDQPRTRTIVGTWESREDWAAWHDDEAFRETRTQLEGLQERPSETVWYDVVAGLRRD
jgi:heme-degrading monooxygenase HmoA